MKSSSHLFSEYFKQAEEGVSSRCGSYKGLTLEALCTTWEDLEKIFSHPLVSGTWVDLGSGLGQTVIAYKESFPDRHAIGIEFESSRIAVARSIAQELCVQCEFISGDLRSEPLPRGDVYFLYFPQGPVLDRILSELLKKQDFILVCIESHGDLFSRLEKESWLSLVDEVEITSKRHNPFARIYRPNKKNRKLSGLHPYSFSEHFFLIKDSEIEWWGDSLDLELSGEDYLLRWPPRTVKKESIVKIVTRAELDSVLLFLIELRRLTDILVHALGRTYSGPLRKISTYPGFWVEFPSGERVEWSKIDRIYRGQYLCYESSSHYFSLPPAP